MLKFLGVSRSGYRSFLNRKISSAIQRKEAIKKNIRLIYDASKQNYGAPKITKELRKSGETIAERTVGKYMREMGIKAHCVRIFGCPFFCHMFQCYKSFLFIRSLVNHL
ncbi:MAG: IS3 family transposase [Lachnospiraceae bacterium oral taxon 082]|nr:IS3 family transposase [Lachnospiraceae bacterium oral taxon 082]